MASAPSRGGRTGTYLTPTYQVSVDYGGNGSPAPKPVAGSDWFGPLTPMPPMAPDGAAGRQFDYPSGYNLHTRPRANESTTFSTLRAVADGYDLLRVVIETRKDQAKRLRWRIQAKDPHSKKDVSAQIEKCTAFFKRPDGFHTFSEWLGMLLEDLFVIDAPSLYKQRNRAGKLLALMPLDGATVKPVLDNFGRTPMPYKKGRGIVYPVAYQQILKGFPAVDYSTRDLIYKPRNVRSTTPYGFSPTESILATINIALRRQSFTTAYFTAGNIPEALIGVPENWTPQQISDFQKYWDSVLEGDAAARRHAKFVPGGVAKTYITTKEPDLKAEFDDWLARIVCFAFSVSPQALVKMMNRASGEVQKAQAEEEGLVPIMQWAKELVDLVIYDELESPDVEFVYVGEDSVDESAKAVILDGQVKIGIKSINEARVEIGLAPIKGDEAYNTPMPYTAMGFQPLNANTDEGVKSRMKITGGPPETQPGATAPKGTGPGQQAATKPKVQTGPSATARKLLAGDTEDESTDD